MTPPRKQRLLQDTSRVTGAVGAAYVINLVGGLFIAQILGARLYGVWKAVQLILEYTAYGNLGINHGVDRECPSLISRGRRKQYQRLLNTSLWFSVAMGALMAVVFWFLAVEWAESWEWRFTFALLGFLVIAQQVFINSDSALGAEKQFGRKAWILFQQTFWRVVMGVLLGWWLGLEAVLLVFLGVLVWASWIQLRSLAVGLRGVFSAPSAAMLIRSGASITVLVVLERLLVNADRVVVGLWLGETAFGVYQMAVFPLPILLLVPFSLRQTLQTELYDRLHRRDGGGNRAAWLACKPLFLKALRVVGFLAPFVAGAVFLGMPMLIYKLLTGFEGAIPLVQAFAVLSFPLQLIQLLFPVVVARGMVFRFLPFLFLMLLLPALISAGALWFGLPLWVVMLIQSLGWGVISASLLQQAFRWFGFTPKERKITLQVVLGPMLLTAGELWALHLLLTRGLGFEAFGWAYGFLGGAIHTLYCAVFLLGFWREYRKR